MYIIHESCFVHVSLRFTFPLSISLLCCLSFLFSSSLTHSLTYSSLPPTHSLTHSQSHTHLFTHLITHFSLPSPHSLNHPSLPPPLTHLPIPPSLSDTDPQYACVDGDIRLVNGTSSNEGRLEICFFNHWGTVCDDQFTSQDASVACRQLGFDPEGRIGFLRTAVWSVIWEMASL